MMLGMSNMVRLGADYILLMLIIRMLLLKFKKLNNKFVIQRLAIWFTITNANNIAITRYYKHREKHLI